MIITIIGSNGFIGSNLVLNLSDDQRVDKLFQITSKSSSNDLKHAVERSDVVINLAGVNRSENDKDFLT